MDEGYDTARFFFPWVVMREREEMGVGDRTGLNKTPTGREGNGREGKGRAQCKGQEIRFSSEKFTGRAQRLYMCGHFCSIP